MELHKLLNNTVSPIPSGNICLNPKSHKMQISAVCDDSCRDLPFVVHIEFTDLVRLIHCSRQVFVYCRGQDNILIALNHDRVISVH